MDALLRRIRDIEAARKMAAVLMARYSSRFVRNGAGKNYISCDPLSFLTFSIA